MDPPKGLPLPDRGVRYGIDLALVAEYILLKEYRTVTTYSRQNNGCKKYFFCV